MTDRRQPDQRQPDRRTCPDCGETLLPDTPAGGCPRCLLAIGLESAADGATGIGASDIGGRELPRMEDLKSRFPALEIVEVLGHGGMGVVYRARQTALDRVVALKVVWPDLAADPALADRFLREARAMARLDHEHVVRIHDFGERDGLYFLLMELVEGASLRQMLDDGGLAPEQALAIVPQICAALQFAHDQGVVHRDIKPANVLVDVAGRVKIADFGLAKLVETDDSGQRLTRAGQVMGTVHYMAPEQYKTPNDVDHRADIYSLGVVFYEMLTGEMPMGRFEPPSHRVRVDVRIDEVVLRSLERERDRRYQSAAEVATEVTNISQTDAPEVVEAPIAARATATSSPAPASRFGRPPLWLILLLLVAFGCAATAVSVFLFAPELKPQTVVVENLSGGESPDAEGSAAALPSLEAGPEGMTDADREASYRRLRDKWELLLERSRTQNPQQMLHDIGEELYGKEGLRRLLSLRRDEFDGLRDQGATGLPLFEFNLRSAPLVNHEIRRVVFATSGEGAYVEATAGRNLLGFEMLRESRGDWVFAIAPVSRIRLASPVGEPDLIDFPQEMPIEERDSAVEGILAHWERLRQLTPPIERADVADFYGDDDRERLTAFTDHQWEFLLQELPLGVPVNLDAKDVPRFGEFEVSTVLFGSRDSFGVECRLDHLRVWLQLRREHESLVFSLPDLRRIGKRGYVPPADSGNDDK